MILQLVHEERERVIAEIPPKTFFRAITGPDAATRKIYTIWQPPGYEVGIVEITDKTGEILFKKEYVEKGMTLDVGGKWYLYHQEKGR